MPDPWSEIAASEKKGIDHLRRANAEHPLEFWWGRDDSGRCLLALDFELAKARPEFPELAGLEIVTFARDSKTGRLVMALVDDSDRDIFLALCNDLISTTGGLKRKRRLRPIDFSVAVIGSGLGSRPMSSSGSPG